jgi:hypothetical protein
MKRVISILSAISVLASCSVATISSSAATKDELDASWSDIIGSVNHSYYTDGYNCENYLLSDEETENTIAKGNFEKGDINLDGTVDFYDAAILEMSYTARIVSSESDDSYAYYTNTLNWSNDHFNLIDYNGDGSIDLGDTVLILYAIEDRYLNGNTKFSENENNKNFDNKEEILKNYFNSLKIYFFEGNPSADFFSIDDVVIGDTNLDGKVDSRDAVTVLKSYADSLISDESTELKENDIADFNSDTNLDGKIDSRDAVVTLKIYADNLIK